MPAPAPRKPRRGRKRPAPYGAIPAPMARRFRRWYPYPIRRRKRATAPLDAPQRAPPPAPAPAPARMPAPAPGTTRPRPAAQVDIINPSAAVYPPPPEQPPPGRMPPPERCPERMPPPPEAPPRNDARRGESVRRGRVFIAPPPGEFLRGVSSRRPPSPSPAVAGARCPPGRMPPAAAAPPERCPFGHNGNGYPRRPRPRFTDGSPRAIGPYPEALSAA